MTIVRSKVNNLIISKKLIYDEDENIIGKINDKPNIPNFIFYTCDGGKTWKKCFLPEDVMKEGGVEAVKATGIGQAEIITAASGWKYSTSDFGATWSKLKKGEKVEGVAYTTNNIFTRAFSNPCLFSI
jgi:photosystem II stability/assembly factor-like uncharacterized protein